MKLCVLAYWPVLLHARHHSDVGGTTAIFSTLSLALVLHSPQASIPAVASPLPAQMCWQSRHKPRKH